MTRATKRAAARILVSSLSALELTVLKCIVWGCSNRDIEKGCGLESQAVADARNAILHKLGALSTADAVRIAIYAEVDAKHSSPLKTSMRG